jgi:hypothetical protein
MLTDRGACWVRYSCQVQASARVFQQGWRTVRLREIRAESIVHCAFSALAELAGGTPALPGCEKHVAGFT